MTVDQSVPRATAQLIAPGDPPRPVEFGHRAVLDGKAVTRRLARELSPIAADLIEIATTVYVADQMAARPSRRELDEGVSWARDLSLEIAVRMPDVWNAHAAGLTELLEWLTDDTWGLTFTQRMGRRGPLDVSQGFLFDTIPHGAAPVLFSGGLDSAAGLATWLAKTEAVAVSVDTNNWMQHVQQRVLSGLNAVSAHTCVPLRYRVSTHGQKHPAESTQRSRRLLFLAVGIATAWTLGHDQLQVFENGVGAVNLPYTLAQFRSQASKAMHPKTIRMAQKLASAISGRPFRIDAPGMKLTKAQLIQMAPAAADGALASSVSCDTGFSARVPRHAPCGTCTSCILRRQSLHSTGKAHLDTGAGYRTTSLEGSFAFQAMLWQLSRLRACLDSEDPWRDLVLQYPELLDTSPLTPTEVIGLYRSYVQEWDDFPEALQIGRTAAL
jgi:7-cyano-7-deazaguanine synthase in queuosine biosynthesis